MIPEPQTETVRFLADPATHGGAAVERLETHISAVFLAGARAYKLKKAVTLPFLDFSTVEARRTACEAELEINRRGAPELYLGLIPITRDSAGRLALDGTGETVDWLVEMRRFDQESLFDRLAQRNLLTLELTEELAERIAAYHRDAPPRPDRGGAEAIAWVIDNNEACFGEFPHRLGRDETAELTRLARAELARRAGTLDERRRAGRVRRCHGDLHLRNIYLEAGHPRLFDAIEFSETLSCIDTLYDAAFLVMDLDHRGLGFFANILMNRYVALAEDIGGLALLPLFLSLRAAIRAHVTARMAEGERGAARIREMEKEARHYLARARTYLAPPPPRLVACGGLSGSGKSRLARSIAPEIGAAPGALVLRSDVLRKQLAGIGPYEKLSPEGYGEAMTERTYRTLYEMAARALATGHSVVADAVFAKPEQRRDIAAVARAAGVPFQGFWLEARPEVAAARIGNRTRNASDATIQVLEKQLGYELGEIDWLRIDSSGPREDTVKTARIALFPAV